MEKKHYKGTKDEIRALNTYVKLMRASESVSARIHGHLAEVGLTISQFGVLEVLYHIGSLSQIEIAKKILKSAGNMTMVIDNLEKRGLVKRERKPEDRRYYAVRLTAEGKKLMGNIFPRHAGRIVEAMNVITEAEQETLGHLCLKLGLPGKK
jgi:MarR family 2-MHQ and catechol resistance regulon transcriptional repressor